jgi:metal-responsive CopG/Arc/MetJ family transcriptional regulator
MANALLSKRRTRRKNGRMVRARLFKKTKNLNLMLAEGVVDRLDAVITEGETRTDVLREAVEREIARREAAKRNKRPR